MKRPFYILPSTKGYHEKLDADSAEDALQQFSETMDTDMSAYFMATDKEPASYPHGYRYPNSDFEYLMSVIVAGITGDIESPFYPDDGLEGADLSDMDAIAKLQESYDAVKMDEKKNRLDKLKLLGKYYSLLGVFTGITVPESAGMRHKHFGAGARTEELKLYLNSLNIPYEMDGDMFVTKKRYFDVVTAFFEKQ